MKKKLTPPSCSLSDEETDTFKNSFERGFEKERRIYNRSYPEAAIEARISETSADPDSKLAQLVVASATGTAVTVIKHFLAGLK